MPAPDPPLLAIETATRRGSVALLRGGDRVERVLPADRTTAESLLPEIDALLQEAGMGLAELGAFAVSIGPGSFTGLRIGVATVKGLAFGSALPVAPVPTLAALALAAGGEGPLVALLDAQRGEVYAAGYPEPGALEPALLPEGLYTGEELAARLPARPRLVGEGVAILGLEGEAVVPGAGAVAQLGLARIREGGALSAAELVPRYVRRAEAEARRTGRATEAL